MAIEEKEKKAEPTTPYKVKKEFTLDKFYGVGSVIHLPKGKIKETLISNKFI